MQWPKRTGLSVIIQSPSRIYPFSSALEVGLVSVRYFSAYRVPLVLLDTLPALLMPINSTPIPSRMNAKADFWSSYRGMIAILVSIGFLLTATVAVIIACETKKKRPHVTIRMPNSSLCQSRHFYEEPISVILPTTIDVSVYDHVRDNYVWSVVDSIARKRSAFHFSSFSLSCCILFRFYCTITHVNQDTRSLLFNSAAFSIWIGFQAL